MNKEIKVSFEQIKRKCKTIKDLRDLYSNIEKMKKYLLRETRTLNEYSNKEEAEADKSNHLLWYPENSYEIVEQDIKD